MTGGGYLPTAAVDSYDLDELGVGGSSTDGGGRDDAGGHAVQWVGTPGVKGPRWAKMPLLTVGMLGIQCVWSIEMGYASPYLLDLGLSKSFMSLVFMAGPLSGLVVQPLIGVFADRSKSRLGRRRPFMLAGCGICVFAMMLLGWARELSGLVGGSNGVAIALAVWAIYLIDFSINAVMSTDRALVVDTLPTNQQEEGSAWAGRMFGFGSVAGFFVGNLDLPPVLPFLGKTQLQILSFITSAILMISHSFTSWAVTERVLLRDDRPQSKNGLMANLQAIWDNMFSLPPGIRTVCIVQFFASLGWFPILFFTTVWVSEIYQTSHPELDPSDSTVNADAVRSGARALFFQAIINIVCSIALPFVVSESGVQPVELERGYEALNGTSYEEPGSATWKRTQEEMGHGGLVKRMMGWVQGLIRSVRQEEGFGLPFKGLTLVRLWWASQFVFAATMAASWFVTTVEGAYFIIGVTGFSWAVFQWAPFCLLGELILIEGTIDRTNPQPLYARTRRSLDDVDPHQSPSPLPLPVIPTAASSSRNTPLHSRRTSRTSLTLDRDKIPGRRDMTYDVSTEGSPMIVQTPRQENIDENDTSLVLRHSDSEDEDTEGGVSCRPTTPPSPAKGSGAGKETADKAGVILGIHNVFLVLPQFIVTFFSSIIFYLMEPDKSLPIHHPNSPPMMNVTEIDATSELGDNMSVMRLMKREGMADAGSPDAVGLIFRIGGVSAAVGAILALRLGRQWAKGRGI